MNIYGKIPLRQFKVKVNEILIAMVQLPIKKDQRYDIWSNLNDRTIQLTLNHLDKDEIIIPHCNLNTFRKKFQLLQKDLERKSNTKMTQKIILNNCLEAGTQKSQHSRNKNTLRKSLAKSVAFHLRWVIPSTLHNQKVSADTIMNHAGIKCYTKMVI